MSKLLLETGDGLLLESGDDLLLDGFFPDYASGHAVHVVAGESRTMIVPVERRILEVPDGS